MDLIRLLVAAYPPAWRKRYGEEFSALIEDTGLRPAVIVNVIIGAARERVRAHRWSPLLLAAVVSVASAATAKLTGQAPNVLWLPRSAPSALLLLGTLGPWLAVAVELSSRRRRPAQGG